MCALVVWIWRWVCPMESWRVILDCHVQVLGKYFMDFCGCLIVYSVFIWHVAMIGIERQCLSQGTFKSRTCQYTNGFQVNIIFIRCHHDVVVASETSHRDCSAGDFACGKKVGSECSIAGMGVSVLTVFP